MDTGLSTWRPIAALGGLVVACMLATTTITVAQGDTLSEIAEAHGVRVGDLVVWNDLDDPDHILEGARLVVTRPDEGRRDAGSPGTYTITPGDTLSAIAVRFGVSVARLVEANDLDHPDRIIAGRTLRLTAGGDGRDTARETSPERTGGDSASETYTIRAGDSLSTIADRFGVSATSLARANGLDDPDRIFAGQVLRVGANPTPDPASAPSPPPPPPPPTIEPPDPSPAASLGSAPRENQPLSNLFDRWSGAYAVPRDLLEALLWKESDWRPDAVGPRGHLGIGQLSPQTVEFVESRLLGRDMDPLDADDGIQMAARLLRFLLERTDSEREALAAWNQGLSSVQNGGMTASGGAFADAVLEIRRQRG